MKPASAPLQLAIASNNAHKIAEFAAMLPACRLLKASDLAPGFNPDENGSSFEQNALIKARALAAAAASRLVASNLAVIADDSGLCVSALDNAPGIRSARFGADCGVMGISDADAANRAALKAALKQRGCEASAAHFVCAIALVGSCERVFVGRCDGMVHASERGENGFGYDAMFYPAAANAQANLAQIAEQINANPALAKELLSGLKSFAELSAQEKNAISHRYAALAQLQEFFAGIAGQR